MHAIYRFDIAHKVGLEEKISYTELAARCSIDTAELRRIMRLAVANHVFQEPEENMIAHSAMSRILIDVPLLHEWTGFVCEEMLPASVSSVDALVKWPNSCDPRHTGFAVANDTKNTFFEEMERDPLRGSRFASAMTLNTLAPDLSPRHLLDGLPWGADFLPKLVVDVGGSRGAIGVEVLGRFPQIQQYIVEDLPNALTGSHIPDKLSNRLQFIAHDCFSPQTYEGADVYLLRMVLHDWPDNKAIAILSNQVVAMKPNSRIILNEICLPSPRQNTCYREQFLRSVTSLPNFADLLANDALY